MANTVDCNCCAHDRCDEPTISIGSLTSQDSTSVGVAPCYPRCSACCHEFDHRNCGAAHDQCAASHIHQHSDNATPVYRHINSHRVAPITTEHLDSLQKDCVVVTAAEGAIDLSSSTTKLPQLSLVDRLLTVLIISAMALGMLIGALSPSSADNIDSWSSGTTNYPIAAGLIIMIYPPLARVRYDRIIRTLIELFRSTATSSSTTSSPRSVVTPRNDQFTAATRSHFGSMMGISLLPSMSGDSTSSGVDQVSFTLILQSVAIYLGIPFAAGFLSWLLIPLITGRQWYNRVWIPWTSPLTLIALLFTIIVMFVLKGHAIAGSIVDIIRICVPLCIYFGIMFIGTLYLCFRVGFSYPDSVTLAFTAASNNFELAIAVAVASFGINADESLAAVVGPLVEVPMMLAFVHLARYSRKWYGVDRLRSALDNYENAHELK